MQAHGADPVYFCELCKRSGWISSLLPSYSLPPPPFPPPSSLLHSPSPRAPSHLREHEHTCTHPHTCACTHSRARGSVPGRTRWTLFRLAPQARFSTQDTPPASAEGDVASWSISPSESSRLASTQGSRESWQGAGRQCRPEASLAALVGAAPASSGTEGVRPQSPRSSAHICLPLPVRPHLSPTHTHTDGLWEPDLRGAVVDNEALYKQRRLRSWLARSKVT